MKVSPSRIKALDQCSFKFYLNEVLKLPEYPHPKALIGTAVHRIFELILAKKRAGRFKHFMETGATYLGIYPAIGRFMRRFAKRHAIAYDIIDIYEMLKVAFLALKSHYSPNWVYHTEKRYEIDFGDFVISGVIDLLIEKPDCFVVIDLKSQALKFGKDELVSNVQASCYQLFVNETYQKPAVVEFVLLRHAPTSRAPTKHLQIVPPRLSDHHAGFKAYLRHMYKVFNGFSLSDAHTNFCGQEWFCQRVCQFRKPFTYKALLNDKDEVISNHFDKECPAPALGQRVEDRTYGGCPQFN